MVEKSKIAESRVAAQCFMRQHFHRNFMEMAGYTALVEVVAFLTRTCSSKEEYDDFKDDALTIALAKVQGRKFLEELQENTFIDDKQDVVLAIKELLRATNINDKVDDFIINNLWK